MWLIFTYLLTLAGCVLGFCAPFYGLLIYVAISILRPESLWSWSVPPDNYSRIVAIGVLAGWAIRGFGSWKLGRAAWPTYAVCGYLGWSVLGALQAPNQGVAWTFVEGTAKIVIPFVVGITTLSTVRQLKQLAWVIFFCQGYIAFDFNLTYARGFNQLFEMGFGGMDNNSVAIALVSVVGIGLFLAMEAGPWWQRAIALLFTACLAHAILFSFSRGGMLALMISAGVAFLIIPKQPKHYAVFAVLVVAAISMAGPQVRDRFMTTFADKKERDDSAGSRIELWGNCLDTIAHHPIFGCGPDHFPLIVAQYGWPAGKEAHTLWLQTAAEIGVPGILCLMLFYGITVLRLWPMARENSDLPDPWLRTAARMVIPSLVGFAVSAQFVSLKMLEVPYFVALLGAAALKLADQLPRVVTADEADEAPAEAIEPTLVYYPGLRPTRLPGSTPLAQQP